MSKSIRIADYLHAEIERLAREEKRSLANMVQLLLEQALKMETRVTETRHTASGSVVTERVLPSPDQHFKPDFKGGRK